jgi:uncharacterized protein (DUF427 family)
MTADLSCRYYPEPKSAASNISGYVAFYKVRSTRSISSLYSQPAQNKVQIK